MVTRIRKRNVILFFLRSTTQEGRGTGCDKFVWIEKPLTGFHRELVQDLRDAVWDKKEEICAMEREIRELR